MERDRHTLLSRACVIKFPFSQRNHFGQGITVGKLQTSTERQQRANRGYKNGAVSVFWYESPRSFNYFINERVPRVVIFIYFFQLFLILIDILGSDSLSHSQSLSLSLSLCSQPQNKTQIFHSLLLPKRHSLFSYISPIFVASITVYTGACDVLTVYVLSFVYFRLVIFLLHCNNLLCLLLLWAQKKGRLWLYQLLSSVDLVLSWWWAVKKIIALNKICK